MKSPTIVLLLALSLPLMAQVEGAHLFKDGMDRDLIPQLFVSLPLTESDVRLYTATTQELATWTHDHLLLLRRYALDSSLPLARLEAWEFWQDSGCSARDWLAVKAKLELANSRVFDAEPGELEVFLTHRWAIMDADELLTQEVVASLRTLPLETERALVTLETLLEAQRRFTLLTRVCEGVERPASNLAVLVASDMLNGPLASGRGDGYTFDVESSPDGWTVTATPDDTDGLHLGTKATMSTSAMANPRPTPTEFCLSMDHAPHGSWMGGPHRR